MTMMKKKKMMMMMILAKDSGMGQNLGCESLRRLEAQEWPSKVRQYCLAAFKIPFSSWARIFFSPRSHVSVHPIPPSRPSPRLLTSEDLLECDALAPSPFP